jgi:uncharacterized damage-inducible protein DinB
MNALDIARLQWTQYNKRMEKVITSTPDNLFNQPIIPGGNSPSWILGHLADTDDALIELLGIGKRLFPELAEIYHHERGKNQVNHLSKAELLVKWKAVVAVLDGAFARWDENEWLSRHTAVSAIDFAKEPHRNKLNVMLTRVTHKASHLGQIAMLKE